MMGTLTTPDERICLLAQPLSAVSAPQLEAVFVGQATQQVAFSSATAARAAAAQLGFLPPPGDDSLNDLPLAFTDLASFSAAFPSDDSWLARAVRDYFGAGGLRAWVVRVAADDTAPLAAYFGAEPSSGVVQPTSGIGIASQIPSAGLLLLPDLERACLAAAMPPPAAPLASTAAPVFHPLADIIVPASTTSTANSAPIPLPPNEVLSNLSLALASLRPDLICLFTLPVGADLQQSVPMLVRRAITYLYGTDGGGPDLSQVQAFAPLVQDASGQIASPSGLIAGLLCANAQSVGVWRSIAGRSLPLGVTPLRQIESNALAMLRQSGIAVVSFSNGSTTLDDDILACQVVHPGSAPRRAGGTRRLVGWLLRNVKIYGEQLVFENVMDDGRVELVLNSLFAQLLKAGALNGVQVSDAVSITRRDPGIPNAFQFDIQVNLALAVETIQLQFLDGTLNTSLGAAA